MSPSDPDGYSQGSVGFEALSYLYAPQTRSAQTYPTLTGTWKGKATGPVFEATADPEVMLMMAPSGFQPYFEMPEAYLGTSPNLGNVQVAIGRKLEQWNHLDDLWRLGIWQPRYRWDYLDPQVVGLTGAFLEFKDRFVKVVAFGSAINIPERGVNVSVENGQLVADSPWFISPPSQILVRGQENPIHYDLQIPPMSQLVFQPSLSVMTRLGADQGLWGSLAYAYKPMNQLLLSYGQGGKLHILENSVNDEVSVPIQPRLVYDSLSSAEFGYQLRSVGFWVSTLMDQPGPDPTSGDATYEKVTHSFAISPTLEWRIMDPDGPYPAKASLSYLRQWGGNAPDQNGMGSLGISTTGGSVFEGRYPFQNAMMIQIDAGAPGLFEKALGSWTRSWTASSEVIWDFGHRGGILSMDLRYLTVSSWQMSIGADLLATAEDDSEVAATDFIGRYRSSDRVRVGMTYAF